MQTCVTEVAIIIAWQAKSASLLCLQAINLQ